MDRSIKIRIPLNLIEIDGDKRQGIINIERAEDFYRMLTKALCEDKPEVEY